MMIKKLLFTIIISIISCAASAQLPNNDLEELARIVQNRYRTYGTEGTNIYKTNSGYRVLVSVVKGSNAETARSIAMKEVAEFFVGAYVNSTSSYSYEETLSSNKESFSEKIVQTAEGRVSSMQMLCRFMGIDGAQLYAFFLVISSTNANRGVAGMISMLIPGFGQFYKGNKGKSFMFLSLTVAGSAGFLVCESTRSSYVDKIDNLRKNIHLYDTSRANAALKEYRDNVNKWETRRNICVGVVGAIYIWNVLDAFLVEGKQRPVVTGKTRNLSIVPQVSVDNMGLIFAYSF